MARIAQILKKLILLSESRILMDGTDCTDYEEAYFLSESRIFTDGTDCTDSEKAYF